MDKTDLILDLIEHPDKYTDQQVNEILSGREAREIYNSLSMTKTALMASAVETDVDAEWDRFESRRKTPLFARLFTGRSRVASIVTFSMVSAAAVAIGIAVSVSVSDRRQSPIQTHNASPIGQLASDATGMQATPADSLAAEMAPMVYEDASLKEIMREIESIYGVKTIFRNDTAEDLKLYFRLDSSKSLDEIIEDLNTFERIDISREGDVLTIE